jgi:hypothetical protein
MGFLLGGNSVQGSSGLLGSISSKAVVRTDFLGNDFDEGLLITEIIDGKEVDSVALNGAFMPHVPFEFGGTQKVVKDYYPGSNEPAVQILGSRESDQTIKGVFKTKRFRDSELQTAAVEFQEKIDSLRMRGNLLKIQLGTWVRYGFMEETAFKLSRLSSIEYEMKFAIVGLKPPVGYKFAIDDGNPIVASRELSQKLTKSLDEMSNIPSAMPTNLVDDLNSYISGISSAVGKITGFVDGIISDVEALQNSANRAIGMIRFYRSYLSVTARKINFMYLSIKNMAPIPGFSSAEYNAAQIKNWAHINLSVSNIYSLQSIMAQLQKRFELLAKSVPLVRHLVKNGETLQSISMKYYNNSEYWSKIKAHNKLESTTITAGQVLEIPKL